MSKYEKLRDRFLRKPRDFTYGELVSLLGHFGYSEHKVGKTAGSRKAFIHIETQHVIRLHKPHPGTELRMYQINEIIEELKKNGLL